MNEHAYKTDDLIDFSAINSVNSSISSLQSTVAGKQDKLTFDSAPTSGSNNPVTSGGIFNAINNKQDKLTFDTTPTSGSSNPVTSGGIYTAINSGGGQLPVENYGQWTTSDLISRYISIGSGYSFKLNYGASSSGTVVTGYTYTTSSGVYYDPNKNRFVKCVTNSNNKMSTSTYYSWEWHSGQITSGTLFNRLKDRFSFLVGGGIQNDVDSNGVNYVLNDAICISVRYNLKNGVLTEITGFYLHGNGNYEDIITLSSGTIKLLSGSYCNIPTTPKNAIPSSYKSVLSL